MRKFIIVIILVVSQVPAILAQIAFSANRPGQLDNPDLTPVGSLMIEAGFQRGFNSAPDLLPGLSLRTGLMSNLEISFNADNIPGTGLGNYNIGGKIGLLDEKGARPKVSFITNLFLPFIGATGFRPDYGGFQFQVSASHTLGQKATLYANLGSYWTGSSVAPVYNYVITLYVSPFSRIWIFGEQYGFYNDADGFTGSVDLGITWQALKNLQVDFTWGPALGSYSSQNFIQAGAAFQITGKKKEGSDN